MFQSYALFPHMTVEQNVGYGLTNEAMSPQGRRERVKEMLDLVKLGDLGRRKPHQISGGQRQRVALARALAKAPKLLLLDEPLAALDKKLREHTQFELAGSQYRTGVTFVVVTHDQEEAMTLANRIAVMDRGRIRQVGTPTEIYEYPRTRFVADFIGSINMLDGRVAAIDGAIARVELPDYGAVDAKAAPGVDAGQAVTLAIRPEKIAITRERPAGTNAAEGVVEDLGYFGKDSLYRVRLVSGCILSVLSTNARRVGENERVAQWEDRVWLAFDPSAAILLPEEPDA